MSASAGATAYAVVKYGGCIHKVRKNPQEISEKATDRAWYIVKQLPDLMSNEEKECRSQMWANVKYFDMKYRDEIN
jgi:hypothetical protein